MKTRSLVFPESDWEAPAPAKKTPLPRLRGHVISRQMKRATHGRVEYAHDSGRIREWLLGTTSTSSPISCPFPEEYGDPTSYQGLANAPHDSQWFSIDLTASEVGFIIVE